MKEGKKEKKRKEEMKEKQRKKQSKKEREKRGIEHKRGERVKTGAVLRKVRLIVSAQICWPFQN